LCHDNCYNFGLQKRERLKPAPKNEQQHASAKADAIEKKLKLKAGITTAMEKIEKIIKNLADVHEIPFDHACTLVHLGGRVFKDQRRPSIQNVYRYCLAHVEDG
jgi:hypothetical protein